jgi:hypothetical protein
VAIRQRTPDLAQSEGLRTVKTRARTRVAVPVLHDEASVRIMDQNAKWRDVRFMSAMGVSGNDDSTRFYFSGALERP